MQDVLMPAVGSNQHLTKFDEKKKVKFSAKKVAISIVFSKTTWKLIFVIVSLSAIYGSYWFAKQTYSLSCGVNGKNIVHGVIRKDVCHDLNANYLESVELARQETVLEMKQERFENNIDLYE